MHMMRLLESCMRLVLHKMHDCRSLRQGCVSVGVRPAKWLKVGLNDAVRRQPGDPRPDPFNAAGGGLDLKAISGSIPAPAPGVLSRERDAFRRLAAATPAPDMEVQPALLVASVHSQQNGVDSIPCFP